MRDLFVRDRFPIGRPVHKSPQDERHLAMIARAETRSRSRDETEDPSPAMIRRQTAAIQRHWSHRTRRRRAGYADDSVGLVEITTTQRRKGYTVE